MKNIADILTPAAVDTQLQSGAERKDYSPEQISERAQNAVDDLFEVLKIHCRNFDYILAHNVDPDFCKREWVKTFMQHKMTLARVKRGIHKIRDKGFGRMIYPVEFIKLTLPEPEDLGAPCLLDAFLEATKNSRADGTEKKWSHPAVRYAFNKTSSWSLSHEAVSVIKPVFQVYYKEGCQLAFEGRLLDQIGVDSSQTKFDIAEKEALVLPEYKHVDRESALEAMKKMLCS